MARRLFRSPNASMAEGATDGKYRKARPNTEVATGMGEEIVRANRAALHPFWNYDFINSQEPSMVSPGETKVPSAKTTTLPVAYTNNYMTSQEQ